MTRSSGRRPMLLAAAALGAAACHDSGVLTEFVDDGPATRAPSVAERMFTVSLLPGAFAELAPVQADQSVPDQACTAARPARGASAAVSTIEREQVGSLLLDPLAPDQFPRGGFYAARIHGRGLGCVIEIVFEHDEVSGTVIETYATSLDVVIGSGSVPEGAADQAPIPDVGFSLIMEDGRIISSGDVTVDIVEGPAPVVTDFRVTNGVTEVVRGETTVIEYQFTLLHAGNLRHVFVGCGACFVTFGTIEGRFEVVVPFTVDAFPDLAYGFDEFGMRAGGVDRAGHVGDANLSLPVVDPPPLQ